VDGRWFGVEGFGVAFRDSRDIDGNNRLDLDRRWLLLHLFDTSPPLIR